MSDFDKEAERQKLREQFADDDAGREATERMSELLLQGATMTNRHCEDCADPIFRYDGQEFCPSCRRPAGAPAEEEAAAQNTSQETQPTAAEGAEPADLPTGNGTPAPEDSSPQTSEDRTDGRATSEVERTPERSPNRGRAGADRPPTTEPPSEGSRDAAPASESPAGLGDARASLERTTTRLARRAEESDDLDRTRKYLSAAREAAEALAAVKRASR